LVKRWLVRHPSFLVKVVATRGICSDDRLWERARLWTVVPSWPCVAVPIMGHGMMFSGDSSIPMTRGHLGYVRDGTTFRARTEPAEAFGVFVQWDPSVFGMPTDGPLVREQIDARDMDRFHQAMTGITVPDASNAVVAANVSEIFRLLRVRGLFAQQPPMGDLVQLPRPRLDHVGRAIDAILSRAGSRPMVVDLSVTLGCSERQARYLVREYTDAYALQGAREWRTLVNVWTTYLAGLLVTARDATTERVASILGYGSPNALCHALTNAGLPPPGEMRRIVAGMG
jgi:hypothetical protein